MKSLLLILILSFISISSQAGRIGSYPVKGCTIYVPRDVPDEITLGLTEKGYNPVNLAAFNTHENADSGSGLYERKIVSQVHETADLSGIPFLEVAVKSVPGMKTSTISIGIAGLVEMHKYTSRKTTLDRENAVSIFSVNDLPSCTLDN